MFSAFRSRVATQTFDLVMQIVFVRSISGDVTNSAEHAQGSNEKAIARINNKIIRRLRKMGQEEPGVIEKEVRKTTIPLAFHTGV